MPEPTNGQLDTTRILFDLQQANEIAQSFAGCVHAEAIARRVTDGLVAKFDCAFARLWLLEPEQPVLRLVASSGLYTHTNGFFSRVPMGAYKVGKIAQNRVSFLSNHLPDEPWVGDRDWAIANQIRGFAGYPLIVQDRVIGVLALFSHQAMAPEFLEVLQTLCTMVAVALDTLLQLEQQRSQAPSAIAPPNLLLSDQLAHLLRSTRMTLVGTERSLSLPVTHSILATGHILNQIGCTYCRLSYGTEGVELDAIAPQPSTPASTQAFASPFSHIQLILACWGGNLHLQTTPDQRALQINLTLPYQPDSTGDRVQVHCRLPLLQCAFSQLVLKAGLTLWCDDDEATIPLLTDDPSRLRPDRRILWIQTHDCPPPQGVHGSLDLTTTPAQLCEAIATVQQGHYWQVAPTAPPPQILSERELEILTLLTQGHRDRDIAERLIISESTVKFHLNNVLKKLKAQTRYQALHYAMAQGWIR